ncbi:alpha/beta fold hydrolase [Stenotrophomonas sp. SY1]|uniref:alpha/beta fold hydrolase n=1 Tax=Stenotrophomonas sp. SY1 TaxID=477235 RepID=UPI001E45F226|nr:alpha/beta fold hydrolase [Stenotrophomonas sp. SY1]MCD9088434.1 lipase family protein [Stenotrophomonas sp. SY1]
MTRTLAILWVAMLLAAALPAWAAPGRMISARAMDDAPAGASAWRIRYETTDLDGDRTESSGVLLVPDGAPPVAGRDVVAWAHGTVGIDSACTPIRSLEQIPALTDMLARGWTVVATDYPGLGTRGPHAYLVGDAAAAAVLDSVRAARNFGRAQAGRRFVAWGHSQGGHAALFSAQRLQSYAPELELLGVAAISPPTDLGQNMQQADATVRAVLTAFTAQSWSKVYGADLSGIADATTRGVITRATAGCEGDPFSAAALLRALRLRIRLGGLDLTGRAPWDGLIARNSLAALENAAVPLLLVQSNGDKLVTTAVTEAFFQRSCQRGVAARYLLLPDTGHATTAIASANTAIAWMTERFAGRPADSDCPPSSDPLM